MTDEKKVVKATDEKKVVKVTEEKKVAKAAEEVIDEYWAVFVKDSTPNQMVKGGFHCEADAEAWLREELAHGTSMVVIGGNSVILRGRNRDEFWIKTCVKPAVHYVAPADPFAK